MVITLRMAWLYALLIMIAFAGGELIGYRGAIHALSAKSPQETETPNE